MTFMPLPMQGLTSPGSAVRPASAGESGGSAPSEFEHSRREWRRNDRPPEARQESAREIRVDGTFASRAGWLHEHELRRTQHRRDPGADAVARDVPGVWKRIRIAEPAIRRDHWNASRRDGQFDVAL